MSVTGLFGDKDIRAVNNGISRVSSLYKLGDRLKHIGIDSSYRPYLTLDDGSTAHNHIRFGTGDDFYQYFNGTDLLIAGTTERVGKVRFTNVEVRIGDLASTTGSGIPVSATNTRAFGAYADDNELAIGSGTMTRAIEGRTLMTYTAGNREQETVGVMGKIVSRNGTNRHNMCGIMGSYEVNTGLTVDGQISSTDPWIQAGVIGRVGAGSNITTLNTYAVLAGVAAMSNTTSFASDSGTYCAYYAGRWGSLSLWDYGFYGEYCRLGIYLTGTATISSEEHFVDYSWTPTVSSGEGAVGVNVAITTAGTAGAWVSAFYGKVTQGATKNVNGYISAAEFEVINSNDNVSDWAVLVLNAQNNGAQNGSHSAYMFLRDYGSLDVVNLFWIADHTAGTKSDTVMFTTLGDTAATHAIKFMNSGTSYWIMCTSTAPSGT